MSPRRPCSWTGRRSGTGLRDPGRGPTLVVGHGEVAVVRRDEAALVGSPVASMVGRSRRTHEHRISDAVLARVKRRRLGDAVSRIRRCSSSPGMSLRPRVEQLRDLVEVAGGHRADQTALGAEAPAAARSTSGPNRNTRSSGIGPYFVTRRARTGLASRAKSRSLSPAGCSTRNRRAAEYCSSVFELDRSVTSQARPASHAATPTSAATPWEGRPARREPACRRTRSRTSRR